MGESPYVLGVHVGLTNVAIAAVEIDDDESVCRILGTNVHLFDGAEDPQTMASLAVPRRTARHKRRNISRKAIRIKDVKKVLAKHNFKIDFESKDFRLANPWSIRRIGLDQPLKHYEIAKALLHITKRRGFRSNARNATTDLKGKELLLGAANLKKELLASGARTVGEYLGTFPIKRNRGGIYDRMTLRELLEQEVDLLLAAQQKLGVAEVTSDFIQDFKSIMLHLNPLKIPKVGWCSLEPTEPRAHKNTYTAESFVTLTKILNQKITTVSTGDSRFMTPNEIENVYKKALTKQKLTFADLRKLLVLDDEEFFDGLDYDAWDNHVYKLETDPEYVEICAKVQDKSIAAKDKPQDPVTKKTYKLPAPPENSGFASMEGYHKIKSKLKKAAPDYWKRIEKDVEVLNRIATLLATESDEQPLKDGLSTLGTPVEAQEAMIDLDFKGAVNLSVKAMTRLIPLMLQGMHYTPACKELGYSLTRNSKGLKKLPKFEDTNNPVVNRSLSQARRLINAYISKYGSPHYIHLTSSQEVGKSPTKRKQIRSLNHWRAAKNLNEKTQAKEFFGEHPSTTQAIKLRLWNEQNGICPYTGRLIPQEALKDITQTEIDYILPKSRSHDTSLNNQLLCFKNQNTDKGTHTPFEKWGWNSEKWATIEIEAKKLGRAKAQRILKREFKEREENWKSRYLNDNRYINRLLKEHLEENLDLKGSRKRRVLPYTLRVTNLAKSMWGLRGDPDDLRSLTANALVLACLTPQAIKKVYEWNAADLDSRPHTTVPWENFQNQALEAMDGVFPTRKPKIKYTGPLHKETVYKKSKDVDGSIVLTGVAGLEELTLEKLETAFRPDKKLYEQLKTKLLEHDNNPKKAFEEPFRYRGKTVRKIRVKARLKQGIEMRGGVVGHAAMVRVDVFKNPDKGFSFIPIYMGDLAKKQAPTFWESEKRTVRITKDHKFWCSWHRDELLRVLTTKGEEIFGYYHGLDTYSFKFKFKRQNSREPESFMASQVLTVEKFQSDYFGNVTKVVEKKRNWRRGKS